MHIDGQDELRSNNINGHGHHNDHGDGSNGNGDSGSGIEATSDTGDIVSNNCNSNNGKVTNNCSYSSSLLALLAPSPPILEGWIVLTHPVSNSFTLTPQAEEKHTADKVTSPETELFPHRSEEVDRALGSATPPTGTQRTGQVDSSPSVEQGGPSKAATKAPPGFDDSSTPSTGKNLPFPYSPPPPVRDTPAACSHKRQPHRHATHRILSEISDDDAAINTPSFTHKSNPYHLNADNQDTKDMRSKSEPAKLNLDDKTEREVSDEQARDPHTHNLHCVQ